MTSIAPVVADRFCDLCFRAYETWQTWVALASTDPDTKKPSTLGVAASRAYRRLYWALRDQAILQVVRLHDRARISNKVTLTIDYLARYGGWDEPTSKKVTDLQVELDGFVVCKGAGLRVVRNQSLAHNDLAAVLSDQPVSLFVRGEDTDYFRKLEMFAATVSQAAKGIAYMFRPGAKDDAEALAHHLHGGSAAQNA
jgi:hypothetical protein